MPGSWRGAAGAARICCMKVRSSSRVEWGWRGAARDVKASGAAQRSKDKGLGLSLAALAGSLLCLAALACSLLSLGIGCRDLLLQAH